MGNATSETEQVSQLIGDIYDAALDPGLWVGTLEKTSNHVGGVALGVSETTVKTHLQHVFEKTGTQRQADLVKLVAGYMSPLAS
jgi:Bacterial regulatory proteins, luxR family